ncbi:5338_t:CDS:2 [Cetraspora pellucida]|uniref:5338_t:CDS:1 n=1 Tax=Cetraspora pellucida TaxID=1433469 RepID=A0ACA9LWT8_9GLOM|nr:5338_t:CDS:2 [Cetraspora pellucida]
MFFYCGFDKTIKSDNADGTKNRGTTGDTDDDDNEEGGNMVAVRLTTSYESKIRDDTSGIGGWCLSGINNMKSTVTKPY